MGSESQRNHLKEAITVLAAQEEESFSLPADLAPLVMRHHRLGGPVYAGSSQRVTQFKAEILATALSGGNVLIVGETGTGKEAIAYFLHELGPQRSGPFYALNCAGLKETTLQSRLFGHVRGAYTGADTSVAGLVTLADGGTLFLDELPDMPQTVQAELLRFLQSGEYTPMGSHQTFYAQVRVVAASQPKRLETVRDDLLHRLRHSELRPPALRDLAHSDPWDLVTITRNLLTRLKGKPRNAPAGETSYVDQSVVDRVWRELASESVLDLLASYDWPGNARELHEVVHRRACRGEELELILQEKLGEMHRRGAGPAPTLDEAGVVQAQPWVWFAPAKDVNDIRPLAELEQAYMDHLRPIATTQGMKTAVQKALGLSHERYLKLLGKVKRKETQRIVRPRKMTR
jgi:DNA-binding NtrC family response regulator